MRDTRRLSAREQLCVCTAWRDVVVQFIVADEIAAMEYGLFFSGEQGELMQAIENVHLSVLKVYTATDQGFNSSVRVLMKMFIKWIK